MYEKKEHDQCQETLQDCCDVWGVDDSSGIFGKSYASDIKAEHQSNGFYIHAVVKLLCINDSWDNFQLWIC